MREYRHYQRIRTRQEIVRRAVIVMLAVIAAGTALLILRGVAQGQTNIGEPWCQVSAPTLPQHQPAQSAPQLTHLQCIQPRVFVPLVAQAR